MNQNEYLTPPINPLVKDLSGVVQYDPNSYRESERDYSSDKYGLFDKK